LWSGEQNKTTEGTEKGQDGCLEVTQENVIYLTADSEEELLELKEGEVYIIGGICDHNRYKVSSLLISCFLTCKHDHSHCPQNLCLNKAVESNIRTARLPIGRYLASLTTRKVLTVNQVFEILVRWVETKDWEEALYAVIPKRKFVAGASNENDDDDDEEEDAGDDNGEDQDRPTEINKPDSQLETRGDEEEEKAPS
jgi:tRNA (guanine9-N1)-methyltransferase